MTFNIWNYSPHWTVRRGLIAGLIRSWLPDVVALQEVRHDWRYEGGKGQAEQLAEATGYHATSMTAQVYIPILRVDEGVALLTRLPPEMVMRRELTLLPHEREDENHRVCLGVRLRIGERDVDAYSTHFSLSPAARLSNAQEVDRFVRDQSGDRPALVMGDLNGRPQERSIRFLAGEEPVDGKTPGFVDCWVAVNGDLPGFTYSSWAPDHRIDYIFARNFPSLPTAIHIIGGDPEGKIYASDHLGMVVDLLLQGQ